MRAESLAVDDQLSWARRRGEEVEVRLRLHGAELSDGPAEVVLRAGKRRLAVSGLVETAGDAAQLGFAVPRARLGRAAWRLTLKPASGDTVRVQARLLAPASQPVALLPGPVPATEMRPPAPKPRPRRGRGGAPRSGRATARRLPRALPRPVVAALRAARRRVRSVAAGR